jgi:hypothetical protein
LIGEPIKNWWSAAAIAGYLEGVSYSGAKPELAGLVVDHRNFPLLAQPILGHRWDQLIRSDSMTVDALDSKIQSIKQFLNDYKNHQDARTPPPSAQPLKVRYARERDFYRIALSFLSESSDKAIAEEAAKQQKMDPAPSHNMATGIITAGFSDTSRQDLPDDKFIWPLVKFVEDNLANLVRDLLEILPKLEKALKDSETREPEPIFAVALMVVNSGSSPTSISPIGVLQIEQQPNAALRPVFMRLTNFLPNPGPHIEPAGARTHGPVLLAAGQSLILTFSADMGVLSDSLGKPSRKGTPFDKQLEKMLTTQQDSLKRMSEIYKTGWHTCRVTLNWGNGKAKHFHGLFGVEAAIQR